MDVIVDDDEEVTMRRPGKSVGVGTAALVLPVGAWMTSTVACSQGPTAPTDAAVVPLAATAGPTAVVAMAGDAAKGNGPQACPPDDKLIGQVAVYGHRPRTWWNLIRQGLDASGRSDISDDKHAVQ